MKRRASVRRHPAMLHISLATAAGRLAACGCKPSSSLARRQQLLLRGGQRREQLHACLAVRLVDSCQRSMPKGKAQHLVKSELHAKCKLAAEKERTGGRGDHGKSNVQQNQELKGSCTHAVTRMAGVCWRSYCSSSPPSATVCKAAAAEVARRQWPRPATHLCGADVMMLPSIHMMK